MTRSPEWWTDAEHAACEQLAKMFGNGWTYEAGNNSGRFFGRVGPFLSSPRTVIDVYAPGGPPCAVDIDLPIVLRLASVFRLRLVTLNLHRLPDSEEWTVGFERVGSPLAVGMASHPGILQAAVLAALRCVAAATQREDGNAEGR